MTQLLGAAATGDKAAFGEVITLAYADLEGVTAAEMYARFGGWIGSLTLTPTDVLHEALQRIMAQRKIARSRNEFFAVATILIGRTIVDYQRERLAEKRGGEAGRGGSLNGRDVPGGENLTEHIEVLESFQHAMEQITLEDPIMAEVLTLRLFGGLTKVEVMERTGLSVSVVKRVWTTSLRRLEELLDA